jgi:O-antigen/teichoic acid export membrane protein
MLSGHYRYILIAYDHQQWLFVFTAIAAASAVVLGFVLEPSYGGPGAACALLFANCLHFALVYFAVRRLVTPIPLRRQLIAPVASLTLATVVSVVVHQRFGMMPTLVAGTTVYLAGLVISDGAMLASFVGSMTKKPVPDHRAAA